ncbi:MAG: hypothetical protein D6689_21830 [Deltaproteobacteria bacterium]|nr:MAG: hypothetical protein D6689_21830 [Deltaproteobacteria bacterium]
MIARLLLGLVKGAAIGGGVGYGAYAAGLGGGMNWAVYGAVGAIVGLLVGRPVWSHLLDKRSTAVTSIIKAVFGIGVCVGLYALATRVWGGFELAVAGETRNVTDWPFILGAAIGGLYGAWVEADDAPPAERAARGRGG